MDAMEIKKHCDTCIDTLSDQLWDIAKYIHANPEVAFTEEKACLCLTTFLNQHGFNVQSPVGGLKTAFKAFYSKGSGPVIGVISEYDALPGLGHACGHNLIAASGVGTVVAVKNALDQSELEGTIVLIGTPAEESGGGKILLLNQGIFDGIDAVFLMHPTSATTRIGGECVSFTGLHIYFKGKSAHAESHPENGINAQDAATLFYTAIGLMRQQLKDNIHICCVMHHTASDIGQIPDLTHLEIEISTRVASDIDDVKVRITNIAHGIALATGCNVQIDDIMGYLGRIPNKVLADICKQELLVLNEPVMDGIPSDNGGEDLGNISRVIPSLNLFTTILPEKKISGHTDQFRELAISENGRHALNISCKAMSRSIVELMLFPHYISDAKEELNKRLLDA
ncbi:peptidase M20 [Gilliamella sp. wkB178]|uniref:amidohydrolase n=1 Tax=Gilliamella sp. wkB178 TaxID=3120259 RepID=UPI00080E4A91|nr:amidohydrolase [Gilliamella apicola]OCG08793.1 peptidase M20 [Gilliamella apicola]